MNEIRFCRNRWQTHQAHLYWHWYWLHRRVRMASDVSNAVRLMNRIVMTLSKSVTHHKFVRKEAAASKWVSQMLLSRSITLCIVGVLLRWVRENYMIKPHQNKLDSISASCPRLKIANNYWIQCRHRYINKLRIYRDEKRETAFGIGPLCFLKGYTL